jgi:hypothetical protein
MRIRNPARITPYPCKTLGAVWSRVSCCSLAKCSRLGPGPFLLLCKRPRSHKVLTYVEYRAVSGVFQNIDPPPPLHPASVSPLRRAVRGVGGGNTLEDARHWIGLLQYNPSTPPGPPGGVSPQSFAFPSRKIGKLDSPCLLTTWLWFCVFFNISISLRKTRYLILFSLPHH